MSSGCQNCAKDNHSVHILSWIFHDSLEIAIQLSDSLLLFDFKRRISIWINFYCSILLAEILWLNFSDRVLYGGRTCFGNQYMNMETIWVEKSQVLSVAFTFHHLLADKVGNTMSELFRRSVSKDKQINKSELNRVG